MPISRGAGVTSVDMMPGVSRKVMTDGEKMMLVEVTLDAGAVVPMHTHPHEQTGYVARGKMRFEIGGETTELGPGDSWMIPGGVPHEATAIEACVVLDIFSPPREDFR